MAFFQIYDNLHIGYNENAYANILHDQLENRLEELNGELLQLYVMFYMITLFSICAVYTIYMFLK